MNGRGRGIWTPDPLLPKQMRYQTALCPAWLSAFWLFLSCFMFLSKHLKSSIIYLTSPHYTFSLFESSSHFDTWNFSCTITNTEYCFYKLSEIPIHSLSTNYSSFYLPCWTSRSRIVLGSLFGLIRLWSNVLYLFRLFACCKACSNFSSCQLELPITMLFSLAKLWEDNYKFPIFYPLKIIFSLS